MKTCRKFDGIARIVLFGQGIANREFFPERPAEGELDRQRYVMAVYGVTICACVHQSPAITELKGTLSIRRLGGLLQQEE